MLLKLANYHNLLNYQFGFNRYYTSYYRNVFKIAAVPFHFGRLMFMKGSYFDHCLNEHIGKVVAIATLFKLLTIMNADISAFQLIIVIISMASMTVGNIMALRQVNVKRILAFSGISHAGFMLMTLLNTTNTAGTLYYTQLMH
jgi:NADH-quinone oxidoreductase subunit N